MPGLRGKILAEERLLLKIEGPTQLRPGTLAEFVETHYWPRVSTKTQRTQETYRQRMKTHFGPLWPVAVEDLTLAVLQPWISSIDAAPKTKSAIWGILTSIITLAAAMGRHHDQSYRLVALPEVPFREPVALSTDECRALMAAAAGTHLEGPVWAALTLGLRRNEVLGLKARQIELLDDRAIIRISDNRQQAGEESKLKNKRQGQARVIVVPLSIGQKLLSFADPRSEYLFTREGVPIAPSAPSKGMAALCKAAGIRKVQFKDLRSTCASQMKSAGISREVRKMILGHDTDSAHEAYLASRPEDALIWWNSMTVPLDTSPGGTP